MICRQKWGGVFTLIVLMGLLMACELTYKQDGVNENSVVVRIFAQQEAGKDWSTNDFTKELEQQFKIKFNWTIVPYAGSREKRQISLASGDYEDSYMLTTYIDQFSQADILRYGQQGVFIPLNQLIEDHAPNIKAALESNSNLRNYSVAPDGNIYGLVGYNECYHCSYPNKMWLNTKWLQQLKLDMPRTTEEFFHVLQAFKTMDPNQNGLADEIPLSGSTENFGVRLVPFLMNAFIYHDDDGYLLIKDGKIELAAGMEEWREGLAYIKSLYDEGLIDPGAFTQNADALKRIGNNRDSQILGATSAMHPTIFIDSGPNNARSKDYNPLPPIKGPKGVSYATYNSDGIAPGAKFVITNKASEEVRVALIKMVDYMFTPEGQAYAEVGKEGTEWRRPVEGEEALNPLVNPIFSRIPSKDDELPSNSGWGGMGHFYMSKEYRDSWVQSLDIYSPEGYERRLQEATDLYSGHEPDQVLSIASLWIDPQEAEEMNKLKANIRSYVEEKVIQFITGNKSLQGDWDEYIRGLKALQVPRYLQIMQNAYDALHD